MPANGPHPCSGWNISSGGKVIHFPHQSLVCHLKFATRVPFNASHCGGFHSSVQARDSSRQQQPLSKEVYTVEMIVIYTVHWCTESWYIFYLIKLDIQEHFAGQGGKHLQRTSPGGWPKKKAGKSGESKNGWPIRVEREKKVQWHSTSAPSGSWHPEQPPCLSAPRIGPIGIECIRNQLTSTG